jgi:SAM-dependent methyltransferase
MTTTSSERQFFTEYGAHRAAEGRRLDAASLHALPYLGTGRFARQWAVRARTYDTFVARVLTPASRNRRGAVRVLDLGAGNGWLSWRTALAGHAALALDIRDDDVDGLRAGDSYLIDRTASFERVAASFETLPLADGCVDVVVYNASLHYALDLAATLREARRVVRAGGFVAVLDSPFYEQPADGEAMLAEKRRDAAARFGERAATLMSRPSIEYLTHERLAAASEGLSLHWHRHRVRYPLWYEMRPVVARLRGRRPPSRFDLWECTVA